MINIEPTYYFHQSLWLCWCYYLNPNVTFLFFALFFSSACCCLQSFTLVLGQRAEASLSWLLMCFLHFLTLNTRQIITLLWQPNVSLESTVKLFYSHSLWCNWKVQRRNLDSVTLKKCAQFFCIIVSYNCRVSRNVSLSKSSTVFL